MRRSAAIIPLGFRRYCARLCLTNLPSVCRHFSTQCGVAQSVAGFEPSEPTRQVESYDAGDDGSQGDELGRGDGLFEVGHADERHQRSSEPRPDGVGHADIELAQRQHEGTKTGTVEHEDQHRGYEPREALRKLHAGGSADFQENGQAQEKIAHTPVLTSLGPVRQTEPSRAAAINLLNFEPGRLFLRTPLPLHS